MIRLWTLLSQCIQCKGQGREERGEGRGKKVPTFSYRKEIFSKSSKQKQNIFSFSSSSKLNVLCLLNLFTFSFLLLFFSLLIFSFLISSSLHLSLLFVFSLFVFSPLCLLSSWNISLPSLPSNWVCHSAQGHKSVLCRCRLSWSKRSVQYAKIVTCCWRLTSEDSAWYEWSCYLFYSRPYISTLDYSVASCVPWRTLRV